MARLLGVFAGATSVPEEPGREYDWLGGGFAMAGVAVLAPLGRDDPSTAERRALAVSWTGREVTAPWEARVEAWTSVRALARPGPEASPMGLGSGSPAR
mgnify:CR=1 FL=1